MKKIFLFLFLLAAMVPIAMAEITCNEVVSRTAPATVNAGETFTVTYTITNSVPAWGLLLEEYLSGACTFPAGGNEYRAGWFSDDGNTKTVSITAPSSGTCVLSGNYLLGGCVETWFDDITISVAGSTCDPNVQCGNWGTCVSGQQTRTCDDGCNPAYSQTRACDDGTTPPTNGDGTDFCQYFDWAPQLGSMSTCTSGMIIVFGGIAILLLLTRRK